MRWKSSSSVLRQATNGTIGEWVLTAHHTVLTFLSIVIILIMPYTQQPFPHFVFFSYQFFFPRVLIIYKIIWKEWCHSIMQLSIGLSYVPKYWQSKYLATCLQAGKINNGGKYIFSGMEVGFWHHNNNLAPCSSRAKRRRKIHHHRKIVKRSLKGHWHVCIILICCRAWKSVTFDAHLGIIMREVGEL